MAQRPQRGFTLIELMVALAIVAVLVAVALPSYTSHVLHSHRSDAMATLAQDQAIIERCYAQNYSYAADQPCTALQIPQTSPQGYYTIAFSNRDATHYTLTATAILSQLDDTTCRTLSIDQTNNKTAADASGTPQSSCWNP
ncbi:MAG: prepilin-type N-terminal cleavage/methylation domain-containing protein [Proteobacteria bacterium]|nr:prepilin-type N-terminal cleavage/methylation domain-containing protein [Pseudomonadota bacterium]